MDVTYLNHMGDDLSVVNAAKVSFGKRSKWEYLEWRDEEGGTSYYGEKALSKQDQRLIQFLARGCTSSDWDSLKDQVEYFSNSGPLPMKLKANSEKEFESLLNYIRRMPSHWSPFAHTAISLHLKMPIFTARQIMKHTTGIEYNEVSRRYVDSEPEFYTPEVWRKRADNVKQGSSGVKVGHHQDVMETYQHTMGIACDYYKYLVNEVGVAPEQARMALPQSMYTEVIATGNLYAWANLYNQRSDSHAQKETQDLAKQIGKVIQPLYPISWESLTG